MVKNPGSSHLTRTRNLVKYIADANCTATNIDGILTLASGCKKH